MNKSQIEISYGTSVVNIYIRNLGVAVKKGTGNFVVFCPTLNILGYSNKSASDAFKDFEENLSLYFEVHIKNKTLRDALTSKKWKRIGNTTNNNFDSELHPALQEKDYKISIAA